MNALRAELFKLRTSRSLWIGFALLLALHVVVLGQGLAPTTAAVDAIAPDGTIEIFTGERRPAAAALVELTAGGSLQMCIFMPVLGALLGGREARRLAAGLLAVPQRHRLLAAKTAAAALWLFVLATLVALCSMACTYLSVRAWNPGLVWQADTIRSQALFVVYAVVYSLIGYAFALTGRGVLVGLLGVVAMTALTMVQVAGPWLDALLPLSAGIHLVLEGRPTGALVIAAWNATALTGALLAVQRRDQ
ncbi:hypothetical protein [Dactylosporangium matsuzakiense]|uniref:Uncharacterized protein n=1 Tax=Dactylosporangium matsuzakiense TaxID=53360 RepID=A0A9W6NM25_9ACTN|nr:hypothetical protein [Dactylosporangium matsuzakiense]UWZ48247.1 hypothetical protein Dmats_18670 [Dactylosporangium matsuzakiense]GLL01482.1 hypothetical protein GCM10017581_032230 [Dactylosporangium matsuzakiense]